MLNENGTIEQLDRARKAALQLMTPYTSVVAAQAVLERLEHAVRRQHAIVLHQKPVHGPQHESVQLADGTLCVECGLFFRQKGRR